MPYVQYIKPQRFRLLISGFPNTGKTTSLPTFLGDNQDMVIITCPGEMGVRSLPVEIPHITSYIPEQSAESSVAWTQHALRDFTELLLQVMKEAPDILVLDGLHSLWECQMNVISGGEYLTGTDLRVNPDTGRIDPYKAARFHSQAHQVFGQMLAQLYHSRIPVVVCTTWEDWEAGVIEEAQDQPGRAADIAAQRYLWPSIPGKMGKAVVGRFDARISAQLGKRCLHKTCADMKAAQDHHVWQFLSKGHVRGVGIKGLQPTPAMKQTPFIHQDWQYLEKLLSATVKKGGAV